MLDAGASVEIISIGSGQVQGYHEFEPANAIAVDRHAVDARPKVFYGALLLPDGTINGDKLRGDADVLRFVRVFFDPRKRGASCLMVAAFGDAGAPLS